MKFIRIGFAMLFSLVGVTVIGAYAMMLCGYLFFGLYQYSYLIIPLVVAILYAILLSYSDSFFQWLLKLKCRELSPDEQKCLKESGVYKVFEKSEAEIKRVLISDDKNLNAFALGSGTITFNLGILEVSEDMLCGVAAHEAGHIAAGDTKIARMFYAFSMIGDFFLWLATTKNNWPSYMKIFTVLPQFLLWLITLLPRGIFILFTIISIFIMRFESREMEFKADKYAHDLGYGEGLKKILNLALKQEKAIEEKCKIKRMLLRWLDTHPAPIKRIQALEQLD